jgi:V-type H+-transporting ATPase subunit D
LVQVASLQTSFVKLSIVIKITSRRVNALEYIVIPKFRDILNYIDEELEEQETEEKVVMKKVLEKRKQVMEEEEEFFRKK